MSTPISKSTDDRGRIEAIRAKFQAEKPSLGDLQATGDYDVLQHGDYMALRSLVGQLVVERKRRNIDVSTIAKNCVLDESQITDLENGSLHNPPLALLHRYAAALGKQLSLADAP